MSETLQSYIPTPLEIRAELEEMVRQDLLGPRDGPEEIVDARNVRGHYIVGLLAPRGQSILPEEQDDLPVDGSSSGEDGKTDTAVPQTASMLPSSIGLTFTVDSQATHLQVTAKWGTYERIISDTLLSKSGEPRRVWKRTPVAGVSQPILLKAGKIKPWLPDPENKEVYVTGLCRRRDGAWTVTLFLVNAQQEPEQFKDSSWIFQPKLIVESPDGNPIFIKRALPPELNHHDAEDRAMQMLYRREVEFGVGHGVAVAADFADDTTWDRAARLQTTVIPTYDVERMEPPTTDEIPELATAQFDMKQLSELKMGMFAKALNPLVSAYEIWIDDQKQLLEQPPDDLRPFLDEAITAIDNCQDSLSRIRAGIALLDTDAQAAEAFQFANRTMYLQRVRSIFAGQVRQGKKPNMNDIDTPRNRSWRPFQLAFVLLNLPALVDPLHPERSDPTQAMADLLWFPTGGGKTEAYLGVAAFAMGIRRLQRDLNGPTGEAGVTVLMRYTLRLLTLQQFQRAATLIAACELIRRENPTLWGSEPFRIGLWVGQRSTPNWTKDAAEAIKRDHGMGWGGNFGGRGTPHQITNCPWCGQPIDPGRNIQVELYGQGRGRTFQFCSDKLGRCPFSRRQSPDEGIPIVVVDEEIYRLLPSLLIATVDKFAQMPWKGAAQMLFGQVNGRCPRHGFRSPEIEDADSHPKKGKHPPAQTQPIGPLRPPDLIIQDELHLISGPLGTLVGLYETAVDRLSSWELNGKLVRPKVIASTATIRRAQNQVNSLFLRQLRIFPAATIDAEDNFFSRRQPSSDAAPGRRYMGICAPGTRLKTILIRVYVAHMAAAQSLFDKYGKVVDPWMTTVGYFNSMRELGGMRRVVDDAVRTRLRRMADRGLANRRINTWTVEELTSRKGATEIPKILDRLEQPFVPTQPGDKKSKRKTWDKQPLDIVLATNMISVGVDVSRLGLMLVAGQPKATAEYIQATSRVGRAKDGPGLVCTVFNWSRPRDLSHYERFEHYHATFYQQVEALSVTPFSSRALDRGLTGVLVSYLRLLDEIYNANDGAGKLDRQHPMVQMALEEISKRASNVTGLVDTGTQVKEMLKVRLDEWLAKADATGSGAILGYAPKRDGRTVALLHSPEDEDWDRFTCLNSLRDVEPNINLILQDHGMGNEPEQRNHAHQEASS